MAVIKVTKIVITNGPTIVAFCPKRVILHSKFGSFKLLYDSVFFMLIFKLNFCIFSGVSCSHYYYPVRRL